MHFLYDLSKESTVVGIFSPVNESVWEHLKLPVLPTLIWLLVSYLILKDYNIDFKKWLISGMSSILICILFVVVFYYTYTGVFGIHSTLLDILSLLIGISLGQIVAYRIYRYAELNPFHYYFVFGIFIILLVMFVVFTFNPPYIPIFKDNTTGTYGINKTI